MAERVQMTIEENYHPDAIQQAYNFYHEYVRNLRVLNYPVNEDLFYNTREVYEKWKESRRSQG